MEYTFWAKIIDKELNTDHSEFLLLQNSIDKRLLSSKSDTTYIVVSKVTRHITKGKVASTEAIGNRYSVDVTKDIYRGGYSIKDDIIDVVVMKFNAVMYHIPR